MSTGDKNFFSFMMFLTILCWIIGTILMALSVFIDVNIFWGVAVITAGTILLITDLLTKNKKNP